jgi:hypothetical protein
MSLRTRVSRLQLSEGVFRMDKNYQYYMIPFDQVPVNPRYRVWFGTWSTDNPVINWSQDKPAQPDGIATWAAAITTGAMVGSGVTLLGDGGKDLPPPPLRLSNPSSPSAFQDAVSQWLMARNP